MCDACFAPLRGSGQGDASWQALTAKPNQEIEIKLKASLETLKQIETSKLVKKTATTKLQVKRLETYYYDSPSYTLCRLGLTLRLRRRGKSWYQTLKTHVDDPVCLFHRKEWTKKIDQSEPDLNAIPAAAWPENICPVQQGALKRLFKTKIKRTRVDLQWPDPIAGSAIIELCLDQGRIIAGDLSEKICEVELELKDGTQSALFDLEDRFRSDFHLDCETLSKSDRGFALLGHSTKPEAA